MAVRRSIERAARVEAAVLITGETGVGKELVAREIHRRSRRAAGPFVAINCAAIPETLIESELFGHDPGAFTDARGARRGAFELADHGTIFLDEIGDLSRTAQPKLLRVLETGVVARVGSESSRTLDIRVIAATNHDLRAMAHDRRFRDDLLWRLQVIEIVVPPLRERREDIPELAEYFARRIAESNRRPFDEIGSDAAALLTSYSWPGNVRELRAVLERALAMSSGLVLDAGTLGLDPLSGERLTLGHLFEKDWKKARSRFEAAYAAQLIERHGGSVYEAARAAGIAPRSLYKMLRRTGLRPKPAESGAVGGGRG